LNRLLRTSGVTRGLDPRVHLLRENSLRRRWIAGSSLVKPGNDERRGRRERKML
jgi:hypothetical protein